MQHLDEGTIHSWLDGALSADEAARVDAHVQECPQCAAAVAEARGFIAGSSRILTALDHAPRGVVPIGTSRRRVDPLVWRLAATVMIVAVGTLAVMRSRESGDQLQSPKPDRVNLATQPPPAMENAPAAVAQTAAPTDAAASRRLSKTAATNAFSGKGVTGGRALAAAVGRTSSAVAPRVANVEPSRSAAAGAGTGAVEEGTEAEPLRVVGTPHQIGAKVTLYQVATGDTVTLTESLPVRLESVVTGAAVAPMVRGAAEKSAAAPLRSRADVAGAVAADSQRGAVVKPSAPPPVPTPALSQRDLANAVHTIRWTDPVTGNALSLTGRMPETRLQELRIRIEKEKSAAAKKNP